MMRDLPGELTDRIIDFLWDDQPALYNCALTCRAWHPSSHYHLIAHLRIESRGTLERFTRSLDTPGVAPQLDRVHSLYIDEAARPGDGFSQFAHTTLMLLSDGRLSRLQELHMASVRWNKERLKPVLAVAKLFPWKTIAKMSLTNCWFDSFHRFQHLVCVLPQLRQLEVRCVTWAMPGSAMVVPEDVRESSELQLRSVRICSNDVSGHFGGVTEWLLRTPSRRSLRSLDLVMGSLLDINAAGAFLRALGSVVEHLSLRIFFSTKLTEDQITLAPCTNLSTLIIQLWDSTCLTSNLTLLLSQIPPNNRLRELQLRIPPLEHHVWDEVAQILAGDRFRDVRMVTVRIWEFPRGARLGAAQSFRKNA